MFGAMHSGVALVKKQPHRTKGREHREHPSGPGRLEYAAGALHLDNAEGQQNHDKRFVLQSSGLCVSPYHQLWEPNGQSSVSLKTSRYG
jgi:hypothetical protein